MMRTFVYSIYSLLAFLVTGVQMAHGAGITEPNLQPSKTRSQTVNITQAIEKWRLQDSISKAANKGARLANFKSLPLLNEGKFRRGGPGMDGGGGGAVLAANGQVRMLDLAVGDKASIKRFDKKEYQEIMTRKGDFVSDVGTVVSNSSFFSCASQKLSRQDNLLLQYLRPENIHLYVVLTELPLSRSSLHAATVAFPSPYGTGFAYQVSQKAAVDLLSPSVSVEYQRPVASYAFQILRHNTVARQVLLVSSQLYQALSEEDRCALQVHELLRYVANFGKTYSRGIPFLVKRPLSTREIEILTYKIVNNKHVFLSEIPATNFYKFLAIKGANQWTDDDSKAIRATNIYSPEDENELSLGEISVLYEILKLSDEGNKSFENGILELGGDILKEQAEILRGKRINLRKLLN